MEIRHYTLNTGHMRLSKPEEVNKDIYFILQSIVDQAKKEVTDLIDNTSIKIIEEENGYNCTLYAKFLGTHVPVMSTAGTKSPKERKYIWEALEDTAKMEFDDYITKVPVEVPYIVDLIHATAPYFKDVLSWTGDFAKCLGWIMLYPEELQKYLIVK